MTKELRRCPFCGGEAKVSLFLGNYGVACTKCLGAILPARKMTKTEAIEEWNRREPMDKIVYRLEKQKELREKELLHMQYKSGFRGAMNKAIEIVKGECNGQTD